MSMSQEEIEALMNGLEPPKENDKPTQKREKEDISKPSSSADEINKPKPLDKSAEKNTNVKDNISEVLSQIDNMQEDDISNENILSQNNLDEEVDVALKKEDNIEEDLAFAQKTQDWAEEKIIKGEFPFPAEPSTKVVSQLNEVANDSEEKAGQIFDVLSFIVDDNAILRKNNTNIEEFIKKEIELLSSLCSKFPNIKLFEKRLQEAQSMQEIIKDTTNRINEEDRKLFAAMELMQFNDINRQKIERVMSVIRKLTVYLNNLFQEDDDYKEIAVAKHIHGDNNSDLVGAEDLDALIAEFSK